MLKIMTPHLINAQKRFSGNFRRSDTIEVALNLTLIIFIILNALALLINPLPYIPDDALVYFQIARNIAQGLGVTFSGQMPTNGFHPLWLLLCTGLAWLAGTKAKLLTLAALLVIALNGATIIALRQVLKRTLTPYAPGLILIGAPYILFVTVGMEGHIATLMLVLVFYFGLKFEGNISFLNLCLLSAGCGGLVLSRLDTVILITPLALWVAWRYISSIPNKTRAIAELAGASLIGLTPIVVFIAINAFAFGDPRPVSGALKMMSAHVGRPNGVVLFYIAMTITGAALSFFFNRNIFGAIQIMASIGAILFCAYTVFLTSDAEAWYYYVIVITAIFGAASCMQVLQRWSGSWPIRLSIGAETQTKIITAVFAVAAGLFGLSLMARYAVRTGPSFAAYQQPQNLGPVAARASINRVLTFDRPGELAFLDHLSVLAADGLTTNLPFQKSLSQNGIGWALKQNSIQAVVVPELGGRYTEALCGALYLSSTRFQCDDGSPRQISKIEAVSRLTGKSLGFIDLKGLQRLKFSPDRDLALVVLPKDGDAHAAFTSDQTYGVH